MLLQTTSRRLTTALIYPHLPIPRSRPPRPKQCTCFSALPRGPTRAHRSPYHLPSIRRYINIPPPRPIARQQVDTIKQEREWAREVAENKTRNKLLSLGIVVCTFMMYLTCQMGPPPVNKCDSPAQPVDRKSKPLIEGAAAGIANEKDEEEGNKDTVPTGTSTIPTFPRVLEFEDTAHTSGEDKERRSVSGTTVVNPIGKTEYQLLGLGVRTVSFLGIQVYVVGLYIATEDIAFLQRAMIQRVDPIASTLVAGEKDTLKKQLFDPEKSEEIWGRVLKDYGIRTLIRIVPTRNTDLHHLRDAFVKHIMGRAEKENAEGWKQDDAFGESVGQLKRIFGGGSVPKAGEVLMSRDREGAMAVWFDDGRGRENGAERLGEVRDERISRAVWLNYLAGKNVASEAARRSIVNGVMEFVERPIGTVATQVV